MLRATIILVTKRNFKLSTLFKHQEQQQCQSCVNYTLFAPSSQDTLSVLSNCLVLADFLVKNLLLRHYDKFLPRDFRLLAAFGCVYTSDQASTSRRKLLRHLVLVEFPQLGEL
jgi:hypothetical protein